MYNPSLGTKAIRGHISFDGIESATVLPFAGYDVPPALSAKLESESKDYPFLEYDAYRNSILHYYLECRRLDNDPFQREGDILPGIDVERLLKTGVLPIDERQEKILTRSIIEKYGKEEKQGQAEFTFAITVAGIERKGRVFIVCYHNLTFNPATKRLRIDPTLSFNTTFLCRYFKDTAKERTDKFSLQSYVDMDLKTFMKVFRADQRKGLEILRGGLRKGEYLLDSRNEIVVIERPFVANLEKTFQEVEREYREGQLPYPMRAFFGNVSKAFYNHSRKNPYLVIYDDKTNIDQVLALYNALRYPVTYVQGPPGTGKTQTLVNVLLSAFFNARTVLMSSGNNKPVDVIIAKLDFRYRNIEIPFPWLRLGNREEMLHALERIRFLSLYEAKLQPDDQKLDRLFEDHNAKTETLLKLLKDYETKEDIKDNAEDIKNFLSNGNLSDDMKSFIEKKLDDLRERYKSIPRVTNEDVIRL